MQGTDESVHVDQWTLATGEQTVVSHEYIVARFWQVIGAPDPPSPESVRGWKVWYPMDSPQQGDARDDSHTGQTMITSSSEQLDAVWELCRFTGEFCVYLYGGKDSFIYKAAGVWLTPALAVAATQDVQVRWM